MTIEHQEQLIADYLAREMSASALLEFERRLANDGALAREVRALQESLRMMLQLDAPRVANSNVSRSMTQPTALLGLLARYAAAAALAFAAGWLVRGMVGLANPAAAQRAESSSAAYDSISSPPDGAATRFVAAYAAHPSDSALARSLGAMARLHRTESDDRDHH